RRDRHRTRRDAGPATGEPGEPARPRWGAAGAAAPRPRRVNVAAGLGQAVRAGAGIGQRPRRRRRGVAAVSDATTPALAIRDLAKRFGPKVAVAGVSLDVPRGCFFGLVGPNGAGKTTTLRMATGLLRPDAGGVWVNEIDVWRDPVRAKAIIGVLPEDLRLFERLTGAELLTYAGLLRNMDPGEVG